MPTKAFNPMAYAARQEKKTWTPLLQAQTDATTLLANAMRGKLARKKITTAREEQLERSTAPERGVNPAKITKKMMTLDKNIDLQTQIDNAKAKIAKRKEDIKNLYKQVKKYEKEGYTDNDQQIYELNVKIANLEDDNDYFKKRITKKDFTLSRSEFYDKYYPLGNFG